MPVHTEPKVKRPQTDRLERLFYSSESKDAHLDHPQTRRRQGPHIRRSGAKLQRRQWRDEKRTLIHNGYDA
ncbi:hypothetical protein KGD82_27925 (plasmid) [Nocardiopsis eucommiae]|uniref:Uncharacterized protein n=1 Tax=Nocardiopsis eucommiae TaxID=2831970 RepID=A0A975LDY6_9ACTN|nr:hypothetical protein KGD82_27925 [Nocardiopsis eucommiae]